MRTTGIRLNVHLLLSCRTIESDSGITEANYNLEDADSKVFDLRGFRSPTPACSRRLRVPFLSQNEPARESSKEKEKEKDRESLKEEAFSIDGRLVQGRLTLSPARRDDRGKLISVNVHHACVCTRVDGEVDLKTQGSELSLQYELYESRRRSNFYVVRPHWMSKPLLEQLVPKN